MWYESVLLLLCLSNPVPIGERTGLSASINLDQTNFSLMQHPWQEMQRTLLRINKEDLCRVYYRTKHMEQYSVAVHLLFSLQYLLQVVHLLYLQGILAKVLTLENIIVRQKNGIIMYFFIIGTILGFLSQLFCTGKYWNSLLMTSFYILEVNLHNLF